LAMSRPIVLTVCIDSSSESWELYQPPLPWHSRAGGGAVHSIISALAHRSKKALLFDHPIGEGEHIGSTGARSMRPMSRYVV
jgi:hypothetical protein